MKKVTNQKTSVVKSLRFCSLGILAACSPQPEEAPRPNIIFIMSDDLHIRLDELREKYGETPEDSFRLLPVE